MPDAPSPVAIAVTDHAVGRYLQRVRGSLDPRTEIAARVRAAWEAGRIERDGSDVRVRDLRLPSLAYVCRHDLPRRELVVVTLWEEGEEARVPRRFTDALEPRRPRSGVARVDAERLRAALARDRGRVRAELERLVAIPSVAFGGFPPGPVEEAAALTAELLRDAGVSDVELVPVPNGDPPAVLGRVPGPPGAPTLLLYAHYDVQPAPPAGWETPPFTPVERGGRLHGRGAADDKCGIVQHLAALRAWDGRPPVALTFVVEGGEEASRLGLDEDVRAHPARYRSDVIVVNDAGAWNAGEAAVTTSLRGVVGVLVEVEALAEAVHSGLFGGPAPDALMALTRILASLHDEHGRVAVAGLGGEEWRGLAVAEVDYRRDAGVPPGVGLAGPPAELMWSRPAITVLGLDAPAVEGAAAILVPRARALVSLRIPPGADACAATDALVAHLRAAVPWGVHARVAASEPAPAIALEGGRAAAAAAERALSAAFETRTRAMGCGGSIPLVGTLRAARPEAEIVVWGAADVAGARIHGPNESVDLAQLERMALAEALLFAELAGSG